jgi:glycosyltransferase involved in cell wall biosynthesis
VDIPTSEVAGHPPQTATARPRVLHVLASLTHGGIETWLMHMLRRHEMFSVEHEVLLTRGEPGDYEEEARQLGIRIHKLPMGPNKFAWLHDFRRFLAETGPYAAVHSHVYLFSAPVLAAARKAKVPVRIAHCHTARSRGADHQTLRHRIRRAVAIKWMKRAATRRIGISGAAIEEIAGNSWRSENSACVLLYGFDFSRFDGAEAKSGALRKRLGIDAKALVIGHIGRFHAVKNHPFLVKAFAALLESLPNAQLVLAGDGPVLDETRALVASLGIERSVHFPGATNEVPAYMAMFDLFVLPSFSEGLGIVCVEAQAAGTRSLVSDAVAAEASVIPGAVEFLSLSSGSKAWAETMARLLEMPKPDPADWLRQVESSNFAIGRCVDELDSIYRSEMARGE